MNRITALPAGVPELLALPLLRSLDLSVNGLERILPGSFIQLPNLRKLNLGFNALRLIEEGTFDGLSRLEQLDLRCIFIETFSMSSRFHQLMLNNSTHFISDITD